MKILYTAWWDNALWVYNQRELIGVYTSLQKAKKASEIYYTEHLASTWGSRSYYTIFEITLNVSESEKLIFTYPEAKEVIE